MKLKDSLKPQYDPETYAIPIQKASGGRCVLGVYEDR